MIDNNIIIIIIIIILVDVVDHYFNFDVHGMNPCSWVHYYCSILFTPRSPGTILLSWSFIVFFWSSYNTVTSKSHE